MVGQIYGDGQYSIIERIRAFRKERRRLWKNYRTFSPKAAWKKIENLARPGDIVSGHFSIDEVALGDFDLRRVTIVRHPASRLLSSYNYSRLGFSKRNFIQKSYHSGRLHAAGKYSFEGYLSFLKEQEGYYGNYACHYVIGDSPVNDKIGFMQEKYFAFGTVEKLNRFCECFENKTGAKTSPAMKNVTEQKTRQELSAKEVALVEELCAEDLELYYAIDSHIG